MKQIRAYLLLLPFLLGISSAHCAQDLIAVIGSVACYKIGSEGYYRMKTDVTNRLQSEIADIREKSGSRLSLSLEYKLDDTTKNPWGDLTISLGCDAFRDIVKRTDGKVSASLVYENKPGTLGDYGHIRMKLDTYHPDQKINLLANVFTDQANHILDYNPAIIAHYDKLIARELAIKQRLNLANSEKEKKLEEEKKAAQESQRKNNKKIFLLQKQEFEKALSLYDENDPNLAITKEMIKKLEKEYEQ